MLRRMTRIGIAAAADDAWVRLLAFLCREMVLKETVQAR